MAGATAYEGAARAEGADIVVGRREPEQHGGVVTWPPVSRYRTAAPSGAPTLSRARVGDGTAPHCSVRSRWWTRDGRTHISPGHSPDIWRARAPRRPASLVTDGSPGVPSPRRRRRRRRRRRHRHRCQFRLSRSAHPPGVPRGGRPVIPEPRLTKGSEGRVNS